MSVASESLNYVDTKLTKYFIFGGSFGKSLKYMKTWTVQRPNRNMPNIVPIKRTPRELSKIPTGIWNKGGCATDMTDKNWEKRWTRRGVAKLKK